MRTGDTLLDCRLIRSIGRGSFGEVWEAYNCRREHTVALKIVERSVTEATEQQEKRSAEQRGAEIQKRAAQIDSRVVEVLDYGFDTTGGAFWIEMELVEGHNLAAPAEKGGLPSGSVAQIGAQLCGMLENLAPAGVVHGDLKPANVIVRGDGEVKVADFGIAKELSPARAYTENPYATTLYSSPERVETGKVDVRSDLWSVGVILYQLVAGRLPFTGQTRREVENRICAWAPPLDLPPECPDALERIVFKMLARRPEERYAGAKENREDLERFLTGQPVTAGTPDDSTVRTRPPAAEDPDPDPDATMRTATRPFAVAPADAPQPAHRWGRYMAAATVTVLAIAAWTAASEYRVWTRAGELRDSLARGGGSATEEAWKTYQELHGKARLSLTLWSARRMLRDRLVRDADRIIADYRNEIPTVTKPDWLAAGKHLARALELDPGDRQLIGKLRLTEAHVMRIDAQNKHLSRAQHDRMVNDAATLFHEAADQIHGWPDPYLGLLRLYTYESADPDQAQQALRKASDYGHPVRNRERAQLGDAYAERARNIWNESRKLTDLPQQEKQYLGKALEDCKAAVENYQAATTYGNAVDSLRGTLELCAEIGERLDELMPMSPAIGSK